MYTKSIEIPKRGFKSNPLLMVFLNNNSPRDCKVENSTLYECNERYLPATGIFSESSVTSLSFLRNLPEINRINSYLDILCVELFDLMQQIKIYEY